MRTRSAALALTLLVSFRLAVGQNSTFTQIGHWNCKFPAGGTPGGLFECPRVKFPTAFSQTPSIAFVNYPRVSVKAAPNIVKRFDNVDAQGFTPILQLYALNVSGTIEGDWIAVAPVILTGTAVAKYVVLTVIYAPPGTNGGRSTSSVKYEAGSTTGTTTSASQSFKTSNSISIEATVGEKLPSVTGGVSFDWSRSNTDNQSLEIKKSTTASINKPGPSQDGINHDEDEIWLLLNPTMNLALSDSSAAWMFGKQQAIIQYLHVGWLNGHQPIPPGVAAALQKAGITSEDYPDILARDPLAKPDAPLDPKRFISLNTTFPYEPPFLPNDPVKTASFTISDASSTTAGSSLEETYKVGVTISGSDQFLVFSKVTFKNTNSWEWTQKSSRSNSVGKSESASLTVGGPAYGYTGPTVMQVYFDTIYKTFVFSLAPAVQRELSIDGTLTDGSGKPLPATEVILVDNGTSYRTFTNAKGTYKFFGHITGPASIQAAGVTQAVPVSQPEIKHVNIQQ